MNVTQSLQIYLIAYCKETWDVENQSSMFKNILVVNMHHYHCQELLGCLPPPLAKQLCFELCTWLDASGTPLFANWLYAARSLFSATKKGRLKRIYNCSQLITFTLHQEDQTHCYFDHPWVLKDDGCCFVRLLTSLEP